MTIWHPVDDGNADLTSHDTFVNGAPHNTFARMRREAPVCWTPWDAGEGFWSITRHADISAMNADTETFSSARGIRMEDQTDEEYLARRTFQETDGMEHRKVRMKVGKAFSAPVISKFEDDIRAICVEMLDETLERDTFDATKTIARELPMRMLGRILGTPDKDLPWLVEKGDALISNTDPDFTDHVLDKLDTDEFRMMPFNSPAGAELYVYAKDLMKARREAGETGGVLDLIMEPDEEGNTISEEEFRNFFCLLVAAGNDTTRYSIAAGIHAMCVQPELLGVMQSGAVWDTVANEIIRWASPAMYFRRTTMRDVEVHGQKIREGDKVIYWFVSGNRDDEAFDDPMRVNLARNPNRHLAFGQGGPHVCLGMWLARLEVRVLFEELAKRISHVALAGEPRFLRSNFVGGLKNLPITIKRI
ncbi:cytochrome P450 [Pseudahrensia aquimaris]|uniref:Cytochrome P450 n=1 Tax=Pseudahrensia aquimaris TaxID=744461 RepID=A0ABW3FGW0_9HYPH